MNLFKNYKRLSQSQVLRILAALPLCMAIESLSKLKQRSHIPRQCCQPPPIDS